ncbi:uncharacterized protein [Enoplosus armatus]|uniref:uncharacterized protein n=1 Tax=Enoplosus armatus TaxID=215367 RepID=UPI0039911185
MGNLTLTTALLLCSFSRVSVSVSEYQTVDAQSGEEVTLQCSNFSSALSQVFWFRAVKRSEPRCIGFMYQPFKAASPCDGLQKGKFELRSNISTLFLEIKQVDSSDSGLYFCGYYISKHPLIVGAAYLEVREVFDLMGVTLGGLIIFLVTVIICLAVKIKNLQKAHVEEENPQQTEGSDDVDYAAVTFHSKTKRKEPASEREGEPSAIYSATR